MSTQTHPPSPSLASLSDASESDIEHSPSADALSAEHDNASAATGDDAIARADEIQHSGFFKGEGLVTLLVEGVSYRVHEYLLTMHSSYWARELGEKKKTGGVIELEDVTAGDMDALMKILYHKSFQGYDLAGFEEWESALRLATEWGCESVRGLAIEKLEPLASPLQKLVMARAFGVTDWLEPALVAFCVRKEPLTLAEGKKLSMGDVIAITATREATRQKTQVVADESEVSAYISKNILTPEGVPYVASKSALPAREDIQIADATTSSTVSVSSTPSVPAVSVSVPTIVPTLGKPAASSATQTMEHLNCLVSALQKPDFDLAVSLVTSESVETFVDALNAHTHISLKPLLSESFVDAILRRGAKEDSFIATGIQLICALPKSMIFNTSVGWCSCKQFLNGRSALSKRAHKGVMDTRSSFERIDYVVYPTPMDSFNERYQIYLEILGGETLTTSLYHERSANLLSFYKQLVAAKMM